MFFFRLYEYQSENIQVVLRILRSASICIYATILPRKERIECYLHEDLVDLYDDVTRI